MTKNTSIASLLAVTLAATQGHGVFSLPVSVKVFGNTLPYPTRVRR